MSRLEQARQTFGRLESDLQEERAAALTRIARKLEALLHDLHEREPRVRGASGADRQAAVAEYEGVRRQARLYRWYLEVQREALGLRRHDLLDTFYRVPGPIEG